MTSGAVEARREIEGAVHEAVDRVVLPALGLAGRELALTIPRLGRSSLVFLVDVEGGRPFVVRVARHGKGRRDLRRRLRAGRYWAQRRLPTPAVLYADLSRATRRATGFAILCEERVVGRNVVDLPPGDAGKAGFEAVGRAFARVHSVERRWHHGSFYQPRLGPYGYRLVKRHREWAQALVRMDAAQEGLAARHESWLGGFQALHGGGPFQLIHRRCTESDVMLSDLGEAWVLEPQRCGFGCFLTDLMRIESRICAEDEARVKALHAGYFAAAPERRAAYDALAPVFRADLHLSNAVRWARKRRKGGGEDVEASLQHELERFREITGA